MGRLRNLGNWFGVKFDKVVKLSDMERVNLALRDLNKKYEEVNDSYATARGDLKFTEHEITNGEKAMSRIDDAAKVIVRKMNADGLSEIESTKLTEQLRLLNSKRINLQSTLNMHYQTKGVQEKVIGQMCTIRTATKAKLDEVGQLKTQLELKDSFTKTMKKYEGFVQGTDGINIDEALKNIEVKFNAANFKFDDLTEAQEVDNLLTDAAANDGLDSWLETLK